MPSNRATELPSYRTTELPNNRATELPNNRATEPTTWLRTLRRRAAGMLLFVVLCGSLWAGSGMTASMQQPPAPSPAQEGFVPIDQLAPKEVLPAAPLVIAAYSVAWIAIFAYVVTIWKRLASVEKEMAALSQRVASGGRR
jgi:CcmD family protein